MDDFENTQLRYKCAQKRYYCDAELYLSSVMLDLRCEDFTRKKLSSRRTGPSFTADPLQLARRARACSHR